MLAFQYHDRQIITMNAPERASTLPLLLFTMALTLPGWSIGATTNWWNLDWPLRQNIQISTGANTPDKGYADYTARLTGLDTASLIADNQLEPDCSDLRVLYWDGSGWSNLAYHLLNCNSASSDLRFAMQADVPASSSDDNYYLYFGNPGAGAAPALSPTNVYLWFDDGASNRIGSGTGAGRTGSQYLHGRTDAWHGTGWDDSATWNAAGYYDFDTGDNFTSGYRRGVDERDVLVEAEFFHTDCYAINMTTGVAARIITSGSGGSENSSHYLAAQRGENSNCSGGGYAGDGDVDENQRANTAVDGPNPAAIIENQWRKQALAVFGGATTNVRYWDNDSAWSNPGYPTVTTNISNSYTTSVTARGEAGIMTAQDQGRWRNLLIRRYVEPEPTLTEQGGTEVKNPDLTVVHDVDQPGRDPGTVATWQVTASNTGDGPALEVVIEFQLEQFFWFDLDPASDPGGPPLDGSLAMACVSGCPGSGGLSINSVDYSDDGGATFNYIPSSGAGGAPAGYDGNITDVRVTMSGRLARTESVVLEYKGQVQ